jgi:hypothetical protein
MIGLGKKAKANGPPEGGPFSRYGVPNRRRDYSASWDGPDTRHDEFHGERVGELLTPPRG